MPMYLVTTKSGKTFRVTADSPEAIRRDYAQRRDRYLQSAAMNRRNPDEGTLERLAVVDIERRDSSVPAHSDIFRKK